MQSHSFARVFFWGALIASSAATTVSAQAPPPGSGPVTTRGFIRVIDGDTIETWIDGSRVGVGFIGFDAPSANTACGREAARFLSGIVQRGLRLEEDPAIVFDARGRRMYYGLAPGGISVARQVVAAGLARSERRGRESAELEQSERDARTQKRGCLWADPQSAVVPSGLPQPKEPVQGAAVLAGSSGPEAAGAEGGAEAASPSLLAALPPNFSEQTVASGFNDATAFTFLPDGRILVAEKRGRVKVVKNGAVLATPFIDILDRVNAYWDHGLLGIAADPNFTSNNYVYLLYTYENNPLDFEGTKTARLTRVTASGDTASPSTEVVLLGTQVGPSCTNFPKTADCIASDSPSHSVGNIKFASDGSMFVTVGDGAQFNFMDPLALRSQDIDVLAGKVLRITTSGAGISSNPFWNGNATANRSKVWAYGVRNAFRFGLHPANGLPYIGDVGWNTVEEINVAAKGVNLGWPCYEGADVQSAYSTEQGCQNLYNSGTPVTGPIVSWTHNNESAAALGGAFYTGTRYPAEYQGAYFYGDYSRSFFQYFKVDNSNNVTSGPNAFATNALGPVDLEMGPDGYLYYTSFGNADIRRIIYSATNTPPTAVASGTPRSGIAPLSVQFSSAGSTDPDGDPLTYSWNFGDGTATSTQANPQHTYNANGTYTAVLTVNDGRGGTATASVTITVGNRAPTATITTPVSTLTFKVGDVISFAGSATDPEDGTLSGASLAWDITLQHCVGTLCHAHPFLTAAGSGGNFTVPDHGDYAYFQIRLTATDSGGLTGTAMVEIRPQTVNVSVTSSPPGLQVTLGGETAASPLTRPLTVGATTTIATQTPQSLGGTVYQFGSWSDGGSLSHNVTIGTANVTYTASFAAATGGTVIRVNSGGPAYTSPQGDTWAADNGFSGGATYTTGQSIANTTTPTLYQSERWDGSGFTYDFAVANGNYAVTLKFAEIYFTQTGQRVFNASINGQAVLTNFDIVASAGGPRIAIDRTFPVSVTNGRIAITLSPVIEAPKLSALEILPSGGSAVGVTVSPKTVTLGPGGTQQFTASVTGTTNTAVTWSISPQTGTISTSGLYTAPATITSTQTVTVTARSAADTTKTDTATITLTPAVVVAVSPKTVTLGANGTQQFTATVTGTTNTAVTWSISPQTGTISTSGLYTAPATITSTQTVTVTARSVADSTKADTATVTLSPTVTVAVAPKTVTLGPGGTQQFTATVTGTANTAVTWSISPQTGTISTSGLYTAPATITSTQTVTVTARSAADTTKSDTATVTLVPPATGTAIRVNSGGPSYTDPQGRVWAADNGFTGGATYTTGAAITGTTTPTLYASERWSSAFAYDFAIPNGNYTVTLKFAEIYFTTAGSRVLNADINGQRVLANFDILAGAGGPNIAVDRSFPIAVSNGRVLIEFWSVIENPKVSAIEIVPR